MTGSRLLLAVASVVAGTAVVLGVLGLAFNLVLLVLAVPFGAAAYFLWLGATGRIGGSPAHPRAPHGTDSDGRARARQAAAAGGPRHRVSSHPDAPQLARAEAHRVLGVTPGADPATVRRAYRERVKEVHPDNGGDEAAFRRVTAAYDRLRR